MIRNNQNGLTIIEILLVLTVAGALLVASIKLYQFFDKETQFEQLQANVDTLFQAMSGYYRVNCFGYGDVNSQGAPTNPGTLNPITRDPPTPPPLTPFPLVLDDLVTAGYLAKLPSFNPLVDDEDLTKSYIVQFNRLQDLTPMRVTACIGLSPGAACTQYSSDLPTSGVNSSATVIWKEQVSVLVKDPKSDDFSQADLADLYRARLGATCTSTISDDVVNPCSMNTPGPYVVWERLPSLSSPKTTSSYWLTMPQLTQFNLQYTHDAMYELQKSAGNQYYLCGG